MAFLGPVCLLRSAAAGPPMAGPIATSPKISFVLAISFDIRTISRIVLA